MRHPLLADQGSATRRIRVHLFVLSEYHIVMRPRIWLVCLLFLCLPLTVPAQEGDRRSSLENKGKILGGHIYNNPALGITIVLSGSWNFFDMDMYSTPESKARLKEETDRIKATCQGPLCGESDINVALQWTVEGRPLHAVFLSAYKLSPEYQNRERHPLVWFAKAMMESSMRMGWVTDGELTPIQLAGKPAYRLTTHHAKTPEAKNIAYVADSNGFVFMLAATAMSRSDELQSAVESMKLEQAIRILPLSNR